MQIRLQDIDFSALEIREIGAWPFMLRLGVIIISVIAAIVIVYMFVFTKELTDLSAAEKQLDIKKADFKTQYTQSMNLNGYKQQVQDLQSAYYEYIRELPSYSNIPELLDSITKIGEHNGLKIDSLKIDDSKLVSDFYMTLPISMSLTGTYHGFGLFMSDLAKLARIVTVGDFSIKLQTSRQANALSNGSLNIDLQAQTYWLASAQELEEAKTEETKPGGKGEGRGEPAMPAAGDAP